jgi:hypothetical protein
MGLSNGAYRAISSLTHDSLLRSLSSTVVFICFVHSFIAKRKQQRRTRQADAFMFRPSVPRFDHLVSLRA